MKKFFSRLARTVADTVKRFLREEPKNIYEEIAFRAVREAASVFGRRVLIT